MPKYYGCPCEGCGKPLTLQDDIVVCPDCGAPYHRTCYEKMGLCIHAPAHGAGYEWKFPYQDAQLRILIRELPLVACAMGRGVDAQTHFLITGAVIGCTAVRADHNVVLKGQRLAAALTGTAIIFRHDILL